MSSRKARYRDGLLKMMFVAGETTQPSVKTTTLVEHVVRNQTVHVLATLATASGEAKFTTNDILFQDGAAPDDLGLNSVDGLVGEEDGPDESEATRLAESDSDSSTSRLKIASAASTSIPEVSLAPPPWPMLSMSPQASDIPSLASFNDGDGVIIDGESSPLPGNTTNPYLLARVWKNDERTPSMTAGEYTMWSECRAASFTFHKKKSFREWCGLGVIANHRTQDDVVGLLGFLTSELVQTLTEKALVVKGQEVRNAWYESAQGKAGFKRKLAGEGPFVTRDIGVDRESKERQVMAKTPIQPRHVRQGFELLQKTP